MDYEKKYEQALAKAKEQYNYSCMKSCMGILEEIFPELKESDEKIRKMLIKFFSNGVEYNCSTNGIYDKDIVAWLEKQGDNSNWHDGDVIRHGAILAIVIGGRRAMKLDGEKITIQYPDEWVKAQDEEREYFFEKLIEKQGEQKNLIAEIKRRIKQYREEKENAQSLTENMSLGGRIAALEEILTFPKQGEQKPAIQPKFNVGDWVVFNEHHDSIYQVEKIENYQYTLRHILGGSMPLPFSSEKLIRHWNIQDVKNGDILTCICVIKEKKIQQTCIIRQHVGRHGGCSNCFEVYCGVDWDGIFKTEGYFGSTIIVPATKNQRDQLEMAMMEAGYKWNASEKKLEKIEQKSSEWKPQTGDTFRKKGTTSPTYTLGVFEFGKWNFVQNMGKGISGGAIYEDILLQDYEPVEQKPAELSEEDENHIDYIIYLLNQEKFNHPEYKPMVDKVISWLKSLRPQKQWKPTEEQLKALYWVYTHVSRTQKNCKRTFGTTKEIVI